MSSNLETHIQSSAESTNIEDRRPKDISDIITQSEFPNDFQKNQFVIDTFKRARSSGYPIHALVPYLDQLPADQFTTDPYDSVVINKQPDSVHAYSSQGTPSYNNLDPREFMSKPIDHSTDQSMNTGAAITNSFLPGYYDPFYQAIGEDLPLMKPNGKTGKYEIDKSNDNKKIYVVRS